MITYNPSRINIGSIGINVTNNNYSVSKAYPVFEVYNKKYLPEFVYLYLKSKEGLEEIVTRCFGSVRQSLSPEDFLDVGIPKLNITEQKKICKIAKKLYENFENSKIKIFEFDAFDTLKNLKTTEK